MVQGCGAKTLKIFVFFFNFLAFLAGVAILVVSVLGYVDNPLKSKIDDEIIKDWSTIKNTLDDALIAGMVIGGLVILLGFLGCCGAIAESSCLLCLFAIILVILAAAQIAAGAVILAKESLFEKPLTDALKDLEKAADSSSGDKNHKDACDFFKTLSDDSVCCYPDKGTCPDSWDCFPTSSMQKSGAVGDTKEQPSCNTELPRLLKLYSKTAGGILIGIAAFEFIAVVFATCLCCSFR